MLKKTIIISIILLLGITGFGQEQSPYQKYIDKAVEYYNKHEYAKAIEELKQVLASENREEVTYAHYFIGYCYYNLYDNLNAVTSFEKCLEYNIDYLPAIEMLGTIHANSSDWSTKLDTALQYLLKAEELQSENYYVYYHLARIFSLKKEIEKAVICLDKAVYFGHEDTAWIAQDADLTNIRHTEYYKRLIHNALTLKTAEKYFFKARQAEKRPDYDEALANYELCLTYFIAVLGEESLWVSTVYNNIGLAYGDKGEYDKAISYFEKALAIRLEVWGENHFSTATSCNNIGMVYYDKGDYEKAIGYLQKALAINLKIYGDDHIDTSIRYNNIGLVYRSRGEYDKAISYYEKALAIRLRILGENHHYTATSYSNIGTAYADKGEYGKAISFLEKAIDIDKKIYGENHPATAVCYNSIGVVYRNKGEYNKALSYYEKALAIRLKVFGENHPNTATSYNNIGAAYHKKGEYVKAVGYYEKALAIWLKVLGENHPATAACYNNIGEIYKDKGEYDKAINYYEKALAIDLKISGEGHTDTATSYNNIGGAYADKGEYDKAISYYRKALAIQLKVLGENHPLTAASYNNIGLSYANKGEYDKAVGYYEKALAVLKRSGAYQTAIFAAWNFGMLYLELGNYKKAKAYYEEAIAVIEQARSQIGSGKAEFMARNIDSYYYSLKCSVLLKDPKGVFAASEAMRARGFLDRLSLSAALSVEGVSEADRKKMIELNDELESLVRQREHELKKETAEQDRERLVKLADAILTKEKEFAALDAKLMKNERYKNLRRPALADLAAAQKLCMDKSAILEYVIWEGADANKQSYCLVITRKGTAVVELDKDFDYSTAVEKFRDAVMASAYDPEAADEPAALLYAALIAPLEKELKGVEQLIIVPDGPLAFLPFDALKKEAKSPYLCESYAVSLSPSVSVMLMVKGRSYKANKKELLAFGGAVYEEGAGVDRGKLKGKKERGLDESEKESTARAAIYEGLGTYYDTLGYSWENLPGTLEEVKQINGEVFGRKNTLLFTGAEVSEQKVKELSRSNVLKEYKVIHFACHGYYEQSYPSFSSIIFSEVSKALPSPEDGYLTVEEAALLKLEAELVNMSACETGLGKIVRGDGVVGLTRALLTAGSNRVGVTLWSVADDATSEFMVQVYKKVVKEKKSFKQAYHETKLEFIRSNNFSSPYFWSPFVVYGSF